MIGGMHQRQLHEVAAVSQVYGRGAAQQVLLVPAGNRFAFTNHHAQGIRPDTPYRNRLGPGPRFERLLQLMDIERKESLTDIVAQGCLDFAPIQVLEIGLQLDAANWQDLLCLVEIETTQQHRHY